MNILVLGGTGAMGEALVRLLRDENSVTVTSRSKRQSNYKNVRYIEGNAKEIKFLKDILSGGYEVIVDFMVYSTAEFKDRYKLFLDYTKQYVFISSARVYGQSDDPITENAQRLLDVLKDEEYLATDEYALAKARCEDLLNSSGKCNYTIIRPSITYGNERLQLGVLEKENWLYRALHGRSIVFSKDIASKYTTMTRAEDVAKGIISLLGRKEALGRSFHITSEKAYTWQEVMERYLKVLEEEGIKPKVVMTEKSVKLRTSAKYQVIYCRYFDRRFDNSRMKQFVDIDGFVDPMDGLAEALHNCVENPNFKKIDWGIEAWHDKAADEYTPLKEIPSVKGKIMYILRRNSMDFILDFAIGLKAEWKKCRGG